MAEIREAVNSLEENKCPPFADGFYVGVIHPDIKYDLQGETAVWQEVAKYIAPEMLKGQAGGMAPGMGGVVGALYAVKFVMSQLAMLLDSSGSASVDVYQSYIFGPEHYGVGMLQDVQTIIHNPSPKSVLDLYGTAGWKTAFSTKELSSKRMTRLESNSSLGAN